MACLYGIELLPDNIAECRVNVLKVLADYLQIDEDDEDYRAAFRILSQNLIHGDALAMRTAAGRPIVFAQWSYIGKGKFQRRDFRLDILTLGSGFAEEQLPFAHAGKHEVFTPVATYPPMTVRALARSDWPAGAGEAA